MPGSNDHATGGLPHFQICIIRIWSIHLGGLFCIIFHFINVDISITVNKNIVGNQAKLIL